LADWAFEPLGTAASNLHNIGDEEGINIRLEWRAGATGRLEESPMIGSTRATADESAPDR
jgi:hypothetical protein